MQRVAQLPIPPPLLASWEIADRLPNQTICPTQDCWNVLTEIAGQPDTDFSHRGERSTLYTVYITLYTHLGGSFWVLRQNLQQVAPNQEKPHTTPLHSLIYSIYISVGRTVSFNQPSSKIGSIKDDLSCTLLWVSLEAPHCEDWRCDNEWGGYRCEYMYECTLLLPI